MSDITCSTVLQTPSGQFWAPEGKVEVFICPKCSKTHLSIYLDGYLYAMADIHEDQAIELSKQLVNPPTLEGMGYEVKR